jgi:hypothetical protein
MTDDFEAEPVPLRDDATGARRRSVERTDVDALLAILRQIMTAGRCELPAAASGEVLERWEDEEHVYFGADLPDNCMDADISIHDGILMIRLEKVLEASTFERAAHRT